MNNPTTAIKIARTFATVSEALEASGMDVSYNPREAINSAKRLDHPNRYYILQGKVMLTELGDIFYTLKCADGLTVLNEFAPFSACLSDADFTLATITETEITIHHNLTFRKCDRKALAKIEGVIVH